MKSNLSQCQVNMLANVVSKDNTLRFFADGQAVLNLDVLTKKSWQNGQGETQSKDDYFSVRLLGEVAQSLLAPVAAGDSVYLQGSLNKVIDAKQMTLVKKPNKLYWNRAYHQGEVTAIKTLTSVNNSAYLQLAVGTDSDALQVNLRGKTASIMQNQLQLGQHIIVEGALASRSVKTNNGYDRQVWLDGHTAVTTS
ncbi:single-stranded DNA-binding protein [Motilimonas pumila]|nr:single-stranded DNA-binding protein [Motilimonas pumila]